MNRQESETHENSSDSVSIQIKKKKKDKRKEKKHKKKKQKHKASDSEVGNNKKSTSKKRKRSKEKKCSKEKKMKLDNSDLDHMPGPSVPVDLLVENSKSRAPMTKEEWEKSQSVIKRVYDETGRSRLIKGDGEILEEIVSKEKHREINRQATLGDGLYFQSKLQSEIK